MARSKFKGMRNHEAARYARWSAAIAIAICLAVIGVYVQRQVRGRVGETGVHPVPAVVAQQSAGFTISRAIGPRTIFTVHASQATEFKDQNRLLENVDITIYGPRGDRNDSVHAGECSDEPKTGSIRCQGLVEIDLRNSRGNAGGGKSGLHLETSNILFEHDSGKVSTEHPVTLKFPGGDGTGTGLVYDPQTENATLEKDVRLEFQAASNSNAAPVRISGSALEFRRRENVVRVAGPVRVQQDARTLTAGSLELQLDSAMQPLRAAAMGNPEVAANTARGSVSLSGAQMAADFSSAGIIEQVSFDENVRGDIRTRDGEDHFSAQHAQIVMNSERRHIAAREMLAQGDVNVEMRAPKSRGNLTTESLRLELSPDQSGHGEQIVSAESLAPAKMITSRPSETDEIQGGNLRAIFGANGEISELYGASGVRLVRNRAAKPPEMSSAKNLVAKFDPGGQWRTVEEKGDVTLQQGMKHGAANSATMIRAAGKITLDGTASVDDSTSHLQADEIEINQTTGELSAHGSVAASFTKGGDRQAGAVHISADEMTGSSPANSPVTNSRGKDGHAIFSGHARMWQGSDVLQAQTIEFWQSEQHAEARGNVLGEFVEAPRNTRQMEFANKKAGRKNPLPVLWQVRAPQADYSGDTGRMEWTGGVEARSSEGTIRSRTMEILFSHAENNAQVERAVATGGVRIEQNGRIGTAERGEYIAREGKFILSGGPPTLTDSSGNSTTGRELTFFLASDTILVDSQGELRTITKHRAEK